MSKNRKLKMNFNEEWLKKISNKFKLLKRDGVVVLPWRHGVADSLRHTVQFIRNQKDEDFACVTKVADGEFVTVPFSLYVKLLESYQKNEEQ